MFIEEYDEKKQQIRLAKTTKCTVLLTALSEGNFLRKAWDGLKSVVWRGYCEIDEIIGTIVRYVLLKKCEVVNNRIVFGTFQNAYACNEKYIAEKIIEKGLDYELIFIVSKDVYDHKDDYEIPSQIRLVKRNTLESFLMLASAHVWIDNALNCIWKDIPKKKEQIYLNTWHGSLGIKKLDGGIKWRKIAKKGNKVIDYFITDSVFEENVFRESFWKDVPHLKFGHARNDIFFDNVKMEALRKKVYDYYELSYDKKTVMYAPTFRDDKSDVSAIQMDFERLKKSLEERFGGEWVVISRLHFHNAKNKKTKNTFNNVDNIIDASKYPDMQELMAAVDVGITDYSSWIFDYLFTGRPAFIYAADIEKYVNSRGFYYSLNETPFLIADSDEALSKNIAAFDEAVFNEKVKRFMDDKQCYEKGIACESIIDFLEKLINKAEQEGKNALVKKEYL